MVQHAQRNTTQRNTAKPPQPTMQGGMSGWGNAATLAQLQGEAQANSKQADGRQLHGMLLGWCSPEMLAASADTPQTTGIFIADGDPAHGATLVPYTAGMTPSGSDFVQASIRALNGLLGGFAAAEGGASPSMGATDVDFQIFKDLRRSGTGSTSADPEPIREWANDPTKRSIPGWADAAAAQAVPVHGDVVRDYLEGGQLADERVVIAHAQYNPSGAGSAQHSSGTVFWDDGQGMCRNCGTEEEQRTPPAIVLKHELTHAWMDHYFATDRIMVDAMADQPPLKLDAKAEAEWDAEVVALRAEATEIATASGHADQFPDPMHHSQTMYPREVYDAIVNGWLQLSAGFTSDHLLFSPNAQSQAPFGDVYGKQLGRSGIQYEEEQMVTDNEHASTEAMRAWAEDHAPEMLQPGGQLEDLGNRTSYSDFDDFYRAAGPLTTKRAAE